MLNLNYRRVGDINFWNQNELSDLFWVVKDFVLGGYSPTRTYTLSLEVHQVFLVSFFFFVTGSFRQISPHHRLTRHQILWTPEKTWRFGQRPPGWASAGHVETQERLLIFSVDAGSKTSDKGRAAAERLVNEMVQDFGEVGQKVDRLPNSFRIWICLDIKAKHTHTHI